MYILNTQYFTSINQTQRNPLSTSEKYSFIPTIQVLQVFADYGWYPVKARQARVRKKENEGYQRHMVRLENPDFDRQELQLGPAVAHIALVNDHGGSSAFWFFIGVLEKVCMNGLIVDRGTEKYRIPHVGYTSEKVADAIQQIVKLFPETFATREKWSTIRLTGSQQEAFAKAAIELRFDGEKYTVDPREVLRVRHPEQQEPTLWNTYNRVQENILQGGVRQRRRFNGTWIRSRKTNSITEDVRLNQALWRITQDTALAVQ